jgi:tryptophanyl-tRNA synthetase
MKPAILSAHNPMTGPRHLGHYVSTIRDWPRLARDHELFIVVDDLIAAILYPEARDDIQARTLRVVRELCAADLDFRRHRLLLTSMVPEVHELSLFTAMAIDHAWCRRLHAESFAGLLTTYQRRELGLDHLPSLAEVAYPQLHLATLAIGLGVRYFQGGEEMRGYLPVIERITERLRDVGLQTPAFLAGATTFLIGTDGRHMASDNAIYLAEDPASIAERLSRIRSREILRQLAGATDDEALAGELASNGSEGDLGKAAARVASALAETLRPFREARASVEEMAEILETSALVARERLRETLIRVKARFGIPGYVERPGYRAPALVQERAATFRTDVTGIEREGMPLGPGALGEAAAAGGAAAEHSRS